MAGESTTCPACKGQLQIPNEAVSGHTDPTRATSSKKQTSTHGAVSSNKERQGFHPYLAIGIAALLGVIGGYFMGRAHLKYELRSAFHSWGEGIQGVFGMDTRGKSPKQLKAEMGKRELEMERRKSFLVIEYVGPRKT